MENINPATKAIAWCLAWGNEREPKDQAFIEQTREILRDGGKFPHEFEKIIQQVQEIDKLEFPFSLEELKKLPEKFPELWSAEIGLVYGGATKIKQYVFEETKLPEIRGASALLDRINLVDLPAFFSCETSSEYKHCQYAKTFCEEVRHDWLDHEENFPELSQALIPELVIYSTGGNILAFCPAAFIDDLANAIEKRYTHETLTANSCAVGDKFNALEIRFGLLPKKIDNDTFWVEKYQKNQNNPLVSAYFQRGNIPQLEDFQERKTFNELAGKLASLYNHRRNGNELQESDRPLRRYPPLFETHPYLKRDEGDRRSAIFQSDNSNVDDDDLYQSLPGNPWVSEASARKRLVGEKAKMDNTTSQWYYSQEGLTWNPGTKEALESWFTKFENFLYEIPHKYYSKIRSENLHSSIVKEAISVEEIGDASNTPGFVAYIYADGNNMGGYIQKEIKTPEDYYDFSRNILKATEESVYMALTEHLQPHKLSPALQAERNSKKEIWIHPFEILTIGGDDVMLIVPANKALEIAKTIGKEFERILSKKSRYTSNECYRPEEVHRYRSKENISTDIQCKLSMSTGVLVTADNTPIYYTEKLTNQLLKSAKKYAKELNKSNYFGGTIDFLVMKSVTMISSNINDFRSQGLTKSGQGKQKLKLYAAPYTLHEIDGLLKTLQVLVDADFPKSQIYQIRSLLERGKQTAILNYRYFRVRLYKEAQKLLKTEFEEKWCQPKDEQNNGNLAPWMSLKDVEVKEDKIIYETIWRELVDLYPFIEKKESRLNISQSEEKTTKV